MDGKINETRRVVAGRISCTFTALDWSLGQKTQPHGSSRMEDAQEQSM